MSTRLFDVELKCAALSSVCESGSQDPSGPGTECSQEIARLRHEGGFAEALALEQELFSELSATLWLQSSPLDTTVSPGPPELSGL
jgi:hypothetical protein